MLLNAPSLSLVAALLTLYVSTYLALIIWISLGAGVEAAWHFGLILLMTMVLSIPPALGLPRVVDWRHCSSAQNSPRRGTLSPNNRLKPLQNPPTVY
jgi:hypothetical protein